MAHAFSERRSLRLTISPRGGARLGADEATAAAASYSVVSLTLDDLLSGEYAIDIHRSSDGQAVACGENGGSLDASGVLSIGLRPAGDSGFSGIAYLSQSGGGTQTAISTFLAETGVGAASHSDAVSDSEPDEQTYVLTVRRQVTLLGGSLQCVDALFDEPRVEEEAWIDQLTAELTLWQILHDEVQETTPPRAYEDFHDDYLEALSLVDSASLDIFVALEEGDQEWLTRTGAKIDEAVQALRALSGKDGDGTPAA